MKNRKESFYELIHGMMIDSGVMISSMEFQFYAKKAKIYWILAPKIKLKCEIDQNFQHLNQISCFIWINCWRKTDFPLKNKRLAKFASKS